MSSCDGTEGLESNSCDGSEHTPARVPKGEGDSDGTNGAGAVLAAAQDSLLPAGSWVLDGCLETSEVKHQA
jgi:hypothetical protein